MTKKHIFLLIIASTLVAVTSHGFFLYQWGAGTYMIGPNDGLSQMVPFREMLYDQFTSGDFFYSFEFGLGGDTYSQLAYYYSINVFFYLTVLVVFLFESTGLISDPGVLFWAQASVFISIARMTLVLLLTTSYFHYMFRRLLPSFLGAVFYATAAKYFQHVTYWEFFGDAFLWLPLLLLGAEKVIREGKAGWLIAAVAVSFFDNFYFAYINGFFTGLYILFRWVFPLVPGEIPKRRQTKIYSISVLLGFGIGSVGFVPAVGGFMQNIRPPYDQSIALFEVTTNILYDSLYLIVPALFVLLIGMRFLYRVPAFRFFTSLALFMIFLHYIPYAASFFNGFSAPQHRYEYLASFAIGGAIAAGLPYLSRVPRGQVWTAITGTVLLYAAFLWGDPTLPLAGEWSLWTVGTVAVTISMLLMAVLSVRRSRWPFVISVIVLQILTMNLYQQDNLYEGGDVQESTNDYITGASYRGEEQQKLMERTVDSSFSRVTWVNDGRYNTPIIQDFYGTSAYSSILNGELLDYYYHDLEIDMKRESVSRYRGFGDRANLHSLWRSNYILRSKEDDTPIPYGFVPAGQSEHYRMYENTNPLPFVRTSSTIYSEKGLEDSSILSREQAVIDEMVVEGAEAETSPPQNRNLIGKTDIRAVGGTYKDQRLTVEENKGGLDITLPDSIMESEAEDVYLSFYLFNEKKEAPLFDLTVNDFETSRKSRESVYKTGVNDLTVRIPKEKEISLRLPEGNYTLKELELYTENYKLLKEASASSQRQADVTIESGRITIENAEVESAGYLSVPVPYEKGWSVNVDGERRELEKVDYAMIGTKIEPGDSDITFTYSPPYFYLLLGISLLSVLGAFFFTRSRKRAWNNRKE